MKPSVRNLVLGCICGSAVPAVVMPLLWVANLAPDPMGTPTSLAGLVPGALMVAVVSILVGLAFSVVIGLPLLLLLAQTSSQSVWIPLAIGAAAGAGIGATGFFGGNTLGWAMVCGVNGAFSAAVAFWCSRPNSAAQNDGFRSALAAPPPTASGRGR
jgi:hypothetical protein